MIDVITTIVDFNREAGLLDNPYDDFLEASFQIEEALEGFDTPSEQLFDDYNEVIIDATVTEKREKYISRDVVSWAMGVHSEPLADVDRLDKSVDAFVFSVGAMAKLGLNPTQIAKAVSIVMEANQAKLGCPKDGYGKLTKPANFPNPEPRLQQLLDER